MGILDKNLVQTRIISGDDLLDAQADCQVILDSDAVAGAFNLTLPEGKNNLFFKVGVSKATQTGGSLWTLVPNGDDIVDAAIGTLGAAPSGVVFKNGTWYLA